MNIGYVKESAYHYGGEWDCWDGDFTTTPTSHPDYSGWTTEVQEQYLIDYPARHIPAVLFTNGELNCGGSGFTNIISNNPPIDRHTGNYSNAYWQRTAFDGAYYSWSPRVASKIVQGSIKRTQDSDPELSRCQNYYWTDIKADRFLPSCTDPKEQNNMAFCHNDGSYIDGKYMFIYKGKVEYDKYHVSDPTNQGATGEISIFCCGSLNLNYRDWYSWPQRNSYGILDSKSHPPTKYDISSQRYVENTGEGGEPYSEYKLSESYQSQAEYSIDTGGWFLPVDSTYISNFLTFNNTYNDYNEEWTYPEGWSPNKYSLQDPYESGSGSYNQMFWNCNGSCFELFLKKAGRFNWYLDFVYPPMWAVIKKRKIEASISAGDLYDPNWYPEPIACWRRTWKEGFGKKNALYWDSDWGNPPGYDGTDCRMWVSPDSYDLVMDGFERYYKPVDISSILSQISDKYAEASDINPSADTKLDDLNSQYDPVQTVYQDRKIDGVTSRYEYDKYEIKGSILEDIRNVLILCRYGPVSPSFSVYQRRIYTQCGGAISDSGFTRPFYRHQQSTTERTSSYFKFGKSQVCEPNECDDTAVTARYSFSAALTLHAINKVPIDATVYLRITTWPFTSYGGWCSGCCEMGFPLGEVGCTCGEVTYTYVNTEAETVDKYFVMKDLCDYPNEGSAWHYISFALTNKLFFDTDWDSVPERVWNRDVFETTFRDCCYCCDDPSSTTDNNDSDAPGSGDDDKSSDDEPLWHEEPRITGEDV